MRVLLSTLLLLGSLFGQAAELGIDPYRFPCTGQITANTAVFDGTNDYARRSSALTALADGKQVTCSFWVRMDGGDTSSRIIFSTYYVDSGQEQLLIFRNSGNKIAISARNAAGTTVLDAFSSSTLRITNGWTHIYICLDLANSANRHMYFNGVEETPTWTAYTNDNIDLVPANPKYTVGASGSNVNKLFAALAELWFDDTYFNDPTKFRCSSNHPVSLGSTGNLPTGSSPVVYLSLNGSGDSWATDSSGNGNTFTVTGALGSTTSP